MNENDWRYRIDGESKAVLVGVGLVVAFLATWIITASAGGCWKESSYKLKTEVITREYAPVQVQP